MEVSDDEEERELASGDGDVDGDGDGCLSDEVIIVEKSAVGGSAGSILQLPERNEDDSGWLIHEVIKPTTTFNKMKPDDMTEIKLTIRCTLKCVVLPVFNLNADLWTIKGSHKKSWEYVSFGRLTQSTSHTSCPCNASPMGGVVWDFYIRLFVAYENRKCC
jgi:hypothetical protein